MEENAKLLPFPEDPATFCLANHMRHVKNNAELVLIHEFGGGRLFGGNVKTTTLFQMLEAVKDVLPRSTYEAFHDIRKLGNVANHPDPEKKLCPKTCVAAVRRFVEEVGKLKKKTPKNEKTEKANAAAAKKTVDRQK